MTDHRDGLDEPGLEALLRRHYRQLDPDPVPVRLAASVRSRLSGGGERHDDAPVGRVPVAQHLADVQVAVHVDQRSPDAPPEGHEGRGDPAGAGT